MSIVKGRGYIIGGESTSLPFQSCDDILQTVGILPLFFYPIAIDIVVCPHRMTR